MKYSMEAPNTPMALPTPPESVDPNALSDITISELSSNISPSPSPSPSPLRRSGRRSAKIPINYCERATRRKRNTNQPEKRQKLSNASPPAAPTADRDQIPTTPSKTSGENALNQPPGITKGNNDTTGTIEHRISENPSPQSPTPAPEVTPDSEALPLTWHPHRAEIPKFTPVQIRNLLQFNSSRVSPRHARPPPEPSLPADSVNMSISTYHLRALARAAASYYASLPREYGDLKSCLPHLYRTFMPTAEFERWIKESGGGMGVRDTHMVLMRVFEVIFSGRFSSVEAKERIWELLGFDEKEVGEEGDEGEEEDKFGEEKWEREREESGRGQGRIGGKLLDIGRQWELVGGCSV